MKKLLYIIIFAAGACTEPIVVPQGEHTTTLAIVALFNNVIDTQTIEIVQSVPYFSSEKPPLMPNASITLSSSGMEDIAFNYNARKNVYESQRAFGIKPNTDYTLRVIYDGREYTAHDRSPDSIWLAGAALQVVSRTDTGRHHPTMLVSGLVMRSNVKDIHVMVSHMHNGKKMMQRLSRMMVGEVPAGSAYGVNPTAAPMLSSVGQGWFMHTDSPADTLWYAPLDTVGVQMHAVSQSMYRYISSVQQEQNASNPMFGSPPANVEGNFSGENVSGIMGLYISGAPYPVYLPLSVKSFDYDRSRWVSYIYDNEGRIADSAIISTMDGRAVYEYPPHLQGQTYFEGMEIVQGQRMFRAMSDGEERLFRIKDYFEFHEMRQLDRNTEVVRARWVIQGKYRREESIISILTIL